jgi:hypothetical protein
MRTMRMQRKKRKRRKKRNEAQERRTEDKKQSQETAFSFSHLVYRVLLYWTCSQVVMQQ